MIVSVFVLTNLKNVRIFFFEPQTISSIIFFFTVINSFFLFKGEDLKELDSISTKPFDFTDIFSSYDSLVATAVINKVIFLLIDLI